jgi:hypothetical protein
MITYSLIDLDPSDDNYANCGISIKPIGHLLCEVHDPYGNNFMLTVTSDNRFLDVIGNDEKSIAYFLYFSITSVGMTICKGQTLKEMFYHISIDPFGIKSSLLDLPLHVKYDHNSFVEKYKDTNWNEFYGVDPKPEVEETNPF